MEACTSNDSKAVGSLPMQNITCRNCRVKHVTKFMLPSLILSHGFVEDTELPMRFLETATAILQHNNSF